MEDPVEGPDRLQGVGKNIKAMGWTLQTPSHLPGLGKKDLKEREIIHGAEPAASDGTVENPTKLFPKPLRCDTPEGGSMLADRLSRGLVDGELELSSQADTPQETQGVFGEHLRITYPDPPGSQVPETPCRVDEVGRILPERDAQRVDREVPPSQVLDDTPSAERSDIHLHSLPSPGKHDPLDPLGEADQSAVKGSLEGCTQRSGVGRDQVDVEGLWTFEEGVTHKPADEVDREQVPFCGQPSRLSQQGMIAHGEQDPSNALVHRLTLREAAQGCQHGGSPLGTPKTA